MEGIIIGIIIVGLVAIIAIVSSKSKKTDKTVEIVEEKTDENIVIESTPSKVSIGKEFRSTGPKRIVKKDHIISKIYENNEESFVWICKNCETENPLSVTQCYVCQKTR